MPIKSYLGKPLGVSTLPPPLVSEGLKQKLRTWRAIRENFGPLPFKCHWIRRGTSLSQ